MINQSTLFTSNTLSTKYWELYVLENRERAHNVFIVDLCPLHYKKQQTSENL